MQARACRSDDAPRNHADDAALKQTVCFSPKRAVRGRAAKRARQGARICQQPTSSETFLAYCRDRTRLTAECFKRQVRQSPSSTQILSKNKMGMDASQQAPGGRTVTSQRECSESNTASCNDSGVNPQLQASHETSPSRWR
jgi:hypothetical protein